MLGERGQRDIVCCERLGALSVCGYLGVLSVSASLGIPNLCVIVGCRAFVLRWMRGGEFV